MGMPGMMPPGGSGGPPGMAGPPEQNSNAMQESMRQGMQNQMNRPGGSGGPGGMPGGPGMAGMPGGPGDSGGPGGGNDKPPDYRSPEGAVQAFIDALKARDLDRVTEATALRAANESSPKNREMFKRILDSTLSESELNALAKKLEGYKILMENMVRSTGRVQVVLMKNPRQNNNNTGGGGGMGGGGMMSMGGGSYYHLVLTVRKEKKGWGVCDIGIPTEFKNPRMYNPYAKKRR